MKLPKSTNLKICEYCNKEFYPSIRTEKRQKYCSKICSTNRHTKDNWQRKLSLANLRRELEPEKHQKWKQNYRLNNADKIRKEVHLYHINNPEKRKEVRYANYFKNELKYILGNKCAFCENQNIQLHHLKYNNLPRGNIKEYAKFIIPLCPRHHNHFHRIINKLYNKQIEVIA